VVVFRPLYAVGGQELGYLPGSENEKMGALGAGRLRHPLGAGHAKEVVEEILDRDMLEVLPLTHIRGRSLHDAFVIVDEAQSLERNVLLTVLSPDRANSKVVLTHDVAQRDNLRVGRHDGVAAVVETLKGHPLFAPRHPHPRSERLLRLAGRPARSRRSSATTQTRDGSASRSAAREQERIEAASRKAAEKKAAQERKKAAQTRKRKAEQERLKAVQANPKPYAIEIMREAGFGDDQWGCLEFLWMGESDFRWDAENPTSGAYGIPQALPASKMASAGPDWKTNPETQMRWGIDYIKQSYGSPCGAANFWNAQSPHWY
jgi:hypothetical protein